MKPPAPTLQVKKTDAFTRHAELVKGFQDLGYSKQEASRRAYLVLQEEETHRRRRPHK